MWYGVAIEKSANAEVEVRNWLRWKSSQKNKLYAYRELKSIVRKSSTKERRQEPTYLHCLPTLQHTHALI